MLQRLKSHRSVGPRSSALFALAALALAAFFVSPSRGTTPLTAYFMFDQESPQNRTEHFVFALTDPTRIGEARDIIATHKTRGVQGIIIKQRAPYNPQWSFHLDPASVGFFEMAIEVCDANVTYVEEHLDEVGGSTLPNSRWCPWSSRLVAEVTDNIDPVTGKPIKPFN